MGISDKVLEERCQGARDKTEVETEVVNFAKKQQGGRDQAKEIKGRKSQAKDHVSKWRKLLHRLTAYSAPRKQCTRPRPPGTIVNALCAKDHATDD